MEGLKTHNKIFWAQKLYDMVALEGKTPQNVVLTKRECFSNNRANTTKFSLHFHTILIVQELFALINYVSLTRTNSKTKLVLKCKKHCKFKKLHLKIL